MHIPRFMSQTYQRVVLNFSEPIIMGILNITPDSFSDGGAFINVDAAVLQALTLAAQGAQIIDIGGESTRPGAKPVPVHEEIERVLGVFSAVTALKLPVVLSIDTRRAEVALVALKAGAEIVNDVSALSDEAMAGVVAEAHAGLILMHMRGTPETMQSECSAYVDLVPDIYAYLGARLESAVKAGVEKARCMLDPGIGFGKDLQQNLVLTKEIAEFSALGVPLVYGPSRKSFLGALVDKPAHERDDATAAACAFAYYFGAQVFRVHVPEKVRDALMVAKALRG